MTKCIPLRAVVVLAALSAAACDDSTGTDGRFDRPPEFPVEQPLSGSLDPAKLTMASVQNVDLALGTVRLPLFKGTYNGTTVWFVRTDVSDSTLAASLGLNFAPRLANAGTDGCLACVQAVQSADPAVGNAPVAFAGTVDFSPARLLVPGPTGFPPLQAAPGAVAGPGYSDLVTVPGSNVAFNAPIVAVGDGPFDVTTHTNTHDRVMAVDPVGKTVDLLIVRAFDHGEDIFYFSFSASAAADAVLERATFVPVFSDLPFANNPDTLAGVRATLVAFTNGKTGQTSPPAQGLMHLVLDGLNAKDANLAATDVLEALRLGDDSHNVIRTFPTLRDDRLRRLYSPMWDVNKAEWTPDVVARGENHAQKDVNTIHQLAARGLVTNPGGSRLSSANVVVNCPVFGFANNPPTEDQALKASGQP